jgi:hypothetical protein
MGGCTAGDLSRRVQIHGVSYEWNFRSILNASLDYSPFTISYSSWQAYVTDICS